MNRTHPELARTARRMRGRPRLPAFACMLAIMATGVLLLFVAVLGRYAASEIRGLQTELLEAQADQILLSARDWSGAHTNQLWSAGTIELPLEDLLTVPAVGRLELKHRDGADTPLIECDLAITQGRRTVVRHVFWPARLPG